MKSRSARATPASSSNQKRSMQSYTRFIAGRRASRCALALIGCASVLSGCATSRPAEPAPAETSAPVVQRAPAPSAPHSGVSAPRHYSRHAACQLRYRRRFPSRPHVQAGAAGSRRGVSPRRLDRLARMDRRQCRRSLGRLLCRLFGRRRERSVARRLRSGRADRESFGRRRRGAFSRRTSRRFASATRARGDEGLDHRLLRAAPAGQPQVDGALSIPLVWRAR